MHVIVLMHAPEFTVYRHVITTIAMEQGWSGSLALLLSPLW